ncbi:TPA: hypothetical protein NV714_000017 [Escherichia coli]|nr:hypothetical protein [Escherichia coli]
MGTFIIVIIFLLATFFMIGGICEYRDREALIKMNGGHHVEKRTGDTPMVIGFILFVIGIIMCVV